MYFVGLYCNRVGLEIHEEQLEIATTTGLARASNARVTLYYREISYLDHLIYPS